ncbi:MAG: molybdopterin-dependent oxidoreductase, partial [Rhodospirillales bacterium]|nr:molybdopterin-dependent oxidoreductase [Rhodospirillales bacterium]
EFSAADVIAEGDFSTSYVEHAYIEPEAGYAVRVGDRLEIYAGTQAPYMDRDDMARIMGGSVEDIRIVPITAGGGFGSKLDISVQPYIALAAWYTHRPARIVYSRTESMQSTTKRHPAEIKAKIGATKSGKLTAMDFQGDFNTGAYASWGPTVANRVPVHASGPYYFPAYRAKSRGIHTNGPSSGAFRGFGIPQTAFAQETLFDELANSIGMDRLEFRLNNALENGVPTITGQIMESGVGFKKCLEALKTPWQRANRDAENWNAENPNSPLRRGVGVAGMWYGCGNTSLPNPSTIKVGLRKNGRAVLFQGAVDIGQGSNTIMAQICADASGLSVDCFDLVYGDTDLTADAGKTSASRQTVVSGKASYLAGLDLRANLQRMTNTEDVSDLSALEEDVRGFVAYGEGTFDPPTSPLDENGQGIPYAVYGYGAHMVELSVDTKLGCVDLIKITASHDVGRAINPMLVEGQIEGGIAQGIGLALMEEYIPGRTENFHDYLIPTIGDVPEIECILIEEADPHGPYGAKGIGEQALIPTAPAIMNAITHATCARIHTLPATPARVVEAIRKSEDV